MAAGIVRPRNMLNTRKLDTLRLHERFALRTNGIGWLLLSPNIGVEMTLGNYNWSHVTLGINGRLMRTTSAQTNPYMQRFLNEGRIEARYYRHGRSLRRSWFAGVYGGYTAFNQKLATTGYRGEGYIAGLTAGTIAPLYGYRNGSSLDLEFSVNAGVLVADVQQYACTDGREYYVETSPYSGRRLTWSALPWVVATDVVRVSFVYHFGPSVADRYRPRATIDDAFRQLQAEIALQRDSIAQMKQQEDERRRDSLEKADYERRFEEQRKELEKMHLRDSLQRVKLRMKNEKK